MKKVIFIVILIVIVGCKAKEPVITGYDTKTAWVPDASKGLIELEYDLATEYYYDLLKDDNPDVAERAKERRQNNYKYQLSKMDFDINKLTSKGWEIKASRRSKIVISYGPHDTPFWGTEYTLQKPIYQ